MMKTSTPGIGEMLGVDGMSYQRFNLGDTPG